MPCSRLRTGRKSFPPCYKEFPLSIPPTAVKHILILRGHARHAVQTFMTRIPASVMRSMLQMAARAVTWESPAVVYVPLPGRFLGG